MIARALPLALLCLVGAGCFQKKDESIPGDELGSYDVVATLRENTCGPGALGAEDRWTFWIRLSRDEDALYWLNGDRSVVEGTLDDAGAFAITTLTTVEARPPTEIDPGCTLLREDRISGLLVTDGEAVAGFEGDLTYGFGMAPGARCEEFMGVEGGFTTLPCSISYDATAVRQE